METVTLLRKLGFAEYEAKAYIALLQRNPLTGYELAKLSGVPRADVYSVLQRLEERGAVLRLEAESGTRFSPTPPGEVVGRLKTGFQDAAEQARQALETVSPVAEPDRAWSIQGLPALLEQTRSVVENARHTLLLAVGPEAAIELGAPLERAGGRGVRITTLCHRACPVPCAHCRGDIHRHRAVPEAIENWLMVVGDQTEMVAGLIDPSGQAAGLRSRQPLLVEMAIWHVRNGIAVAALLGDLGPHVESGLQPETRETLRAVGPASGTGWLEYMASLAKPKN